MLARLQVLGVERLHRGRGERRDVRAEPLHLGAHLGRDRLGTRKRQMEAHKLDMQRWRRRVDRIPLCQSAQREAPALLAQRKLKHREPRAQVPRRRLLQHARKAVCVLQRRGARRERLAVRVRIARRGVGVVVRRLLGRRRLGLRGTRLRGTRLGLARLLRSLTLLLLAQLAAARRVRGRRGGRRGPCVVQLYVEADCALGCGDARGVRKDAILEAHRVCVGAQGHLAHAVRVKVELVVVDVLDRLVDLVVPLQGERCVAAALVRPGVLHQEAERLHLEQVRHRVRHIGLGEQLEHPLGLLHMVDPQQVLGRLGVQVPVLPVEQPGALHRIRSRLVGAGTFQDPRTRHLQLGHRRRVGERRVDVLQRPLRLARVRVVVRQAVHHPQVRRRRLLAVAARVPGSAELLEDPLKRRALRHVAVERLDVGEERGDVLHQRPLHVGARMALERVALSELQREPPQDGGARVFVLQALEQGQRLGGAGLGRRVRGAVRGQQAQHVRLVLRVPVHQGAPRRLRILLAAQRLQCARAQLLSGGRVRDLGVPRAVEQVEHTARLAELLEQARMEEQHLGELVVACRHVARHVLVRAQHPHGLAQIARKLVRHGEGDPGRAQVRLHAQQREARVDQRRIVAQLQVHKGRLAQQVHVAALDPERHRVALDRLLVVAVHAVQDAKRVPADKAAQVVAQALLGERQALLALVQRKEDEALERERLGMVRRLLEDGVGRLDRRLVLAPLVLLDEAGEQRTLLHAKLRALRRHRC